MAVGVDYLVEIQKKHLPILKEIYASKDGSKTHIAYATIDNYIRWLEKDPKASTYIKFYCLNGDFSDGTFIVIVSIKMYFDITY